MEYTSINVMIYLAYNNILDMKYFKSNFLFYAQSDSNNNNEMQGRLYSKPSRIFPEFTILSSDSL